MADDLIDIEFEQDDMTHMETVPKNFTVEKLIEFFRDRFLPMRIPVSSISVSYQGQVLSPRDARLSEFNFTDEINFVDFRSRRPGEY